MEQLSRDLKSAFPDMGGFSADNLRYMKVFHTFYSQLLISEQVVPEFKFFDFGNDDYWDKSVPKSFKNIFLLPWGHHILLMKKIKDINCAIFYIETTIENNWSRAVLEYQIDTEPETSAA